MKGLREMVAFTFALCLCSMAGGAIAFENRECLECHGDAKLVRVLPTGEIRNISVDRTTWEADVHNRKGFRCVACHPQATPYSHPRNSFVKSDCSVCHPQDCEAFASTIHAQKAGLTDKALPQCQDCHTKHAVRPKDDPLSTVNEKRVKETCLQCHPDVMPSGILGNLAAFRISGHRKQDASMSFSMDRCTSCHQRDSEHGEARVYQGVCNDCHNPRIKRAMLGIVGATHLVPILKEQPVTFVLKWLDGLVALCIILAIGGFMGLRYRQKVLASRKRDAT